MSGSSPPASPPVSDWPRLVLEPAPRRWGLRGDPYLYFELGETLRLLPAPSSLEEFEAQVEATTRHLIGAQITTEGEPMVRVDRYPQAGMSGSYVSIEFWRGRLLPELSERYRAWQSGERQNRVAEVWFHGDDHTGGLERLEGVVDE